MGEFQIFQLVIIAALGALNPARPVYMLVAPLLGPGAIVLLARGRAWRARSAQIVLRQRLARRTLDSSLTRGGVAHYTEF